MSVNIYLNFDGNCREAVQFYHEVFKTSPPEIMTFGEGPSDPAFPVPEEAKNRVMHTRLDIHGNPVMFSDTWPGMPFTAGNNFSLTIVTHDLEEIDSLFEKLQEGGSVDMPLQETFWSKRYGAVTDRFGISWQFSHEPG